MVLFSFKFDALKSGISFKQLRHVVPGLDMLNKNEEARSTELFGLLDVEPNSKPLGIKRRVPSISISFKYIYKLYISMQIHYTKNLKPRI